MIRTTVQIKGLQRTLKKIERFGDVEVTKRMKRGLREVGEFIKKESVRRTPEEYGDLRKAAFGGHDEPVVRSGMRMTTRVGYHGKIAPYAWNVHEATGKLKGKPRPSGKGTYWSPGGEPEFLWKAVARNMRKMSRIMRRALKR